MKPPDLATVTLYALDTVVLLLVAAHGEHDPAGCQICWHVHDELDRVQAAIRRAIDNDEPLEEARAAA